MVATNFQHQKKAQDAKMQKKPDEMFKIDWHHKLPAKIKVHTGKGKRFSPFRSAVAVQNEDNLTIFWTRCPSSESMDIVKDDLARLKE